jgi:hypothetical protein
MGAPNAASGARSTSGLTRNTGNPGGRVHHQRCRRRAHAARAAGPDPADQEIGSVTADGAFDTRKCHDAIAARGAAAIIPPRKNAKPWKPDTAGAVARNEILRTSKRVGRTIWRRWSGYHRRSRVETKMHCVKLLGQRLMARDFDRQVAEFQVRVAVLNGFTALGTPVTEVVG